MVPTSRVFGLLALLLVACDTTPVAVDAPVDAGLPDAPAPFDPLAVHWEARTVPALANPIWGHAAATLPDGRALVFGGAIGDGSAASDEALLVDASGGDIVLTPIAGTGPSERWCGCATYDGARDRVLIAGGRNGANLGGIPGDTWTLDVASGTYAELAGASTPSSVIGCALAYSETARATYWFGGASATGVSAVMHRLDADGTAWVALPATGPTPRYDAHLEAIDGGRALLLFAGSYGSAGAAFYSDVWRFDVATETWTEVTVEGSTPPGRRAPWVRMANGERGFYAGFGYDGAMAPLGDLHYFDLTTASWIPVAPAGEVPPARGFSPALEGPEGSVGILFMGLSSSSGIADAYVLARD